MASVAPVTRPGKQIPEVMRKGKYPEVDLTPQQKRQWSETLAALNWTAPGFVHIMYTMMTKKNGVDVATFSEKIPAVAATDGMQLLFKPSQFFKLTLMERLFAVCHEISHCIADHCGMGYQMKKRGEVIRNGKKLPYNPMHANIVQDLIINDMLINAGFGTFKKGWLHDTTKATYMDDWVDVYFKTWNNQPPPPPPPPGKEPPCEDGEGGEGEGEGEEGQEEGEGGTGTPTGNPQTEPADGQFDQHLDPGDIDGDTPEETKPRDEQEWQQAIAGAVEITKSMGKSNGAFEQFFNGFLEPKVDWREHLRALVARKVGSGGYDFRRPDRRLIVRDIIAPGRSGHGAGVIVIGLDTSGSIFGDPTLIGRWLAELRGILEELSPREVHVVECDMGVSRVTVMTDPSDVDQIAVLRGGGGTSFEPVFEYVEENDINPDCLLYLTDGYGSFPSQAPKYAVIWGNISGKDATYPFGDVVDVPVE